MPAVLLLHANEEYARTLASTAETVDPRYDVEALARVPPLSRLSHLLSGRYDLIQVDETLVNGVLAAMTSFLTRTPLVLTLRGWGDYTNAHGQYGRLRDLTIYLRTRAVLRRSEAVMSLSDCNRLKFEERYGPTDASIVGRPIDVEYYRSGSVQGSDTFDLLTVTNLRYEEKFEGVTTILSGLTELFERHDELRYAVAGDGAYLERLEAFLEDYPFADRVAVLGYRDDLPDLFARSDGFVYVSFLDAYPTVVLEAQAAGLPVVGGDAVGVPEVVGEAGVVCPPTPEGVRDALERLVSDDDHRAALAEQSEAKMETHNQRSAERHIAVWDDVLGRGGHS